MEINKIHLMDCIEGLKQIESNSADIVLVDPPYNIGKDFGNSKYKLKIDEYVAWVKEWLAESERILKDSGTMFIYGFSEILAHISVNVSIPHRWLVWHYTNKVTPTSKFWQRSHESIIIAWKDKAERIFNLDAVREPYTETYKKQYGSGKVVRPASKGRFQSKTEEGQETLYKPHEGGALPRDVLKVSALAGGAALKERWFYCKTCDKVCEPKQLKNHKEHETMKHPTQKPFGLTERLFKSCKPEKNGLVVVPFVGSGSELVVAKKLDLNFIGFEINQDYIKLANGILHNRETIKL